MNTPLDRAEPLIAPGHSACVGCGEVLGARLCLDAAGKDVIVTGATGCLEITTSRYPESSWRVPWIHSLFENTAAVAAGIEAALKALGRQDEAKVIAHGGDGATADIGLQALSGMLERGHDVLYICFDNEAYMNTGVQRSSLTPVGARTMTTPPGRQSWGEVIPKKNMPAIVAAHGVPYVAVASVGYPQDLQKKMKKALAVRGPKYLQVHVPCPLGWAFDTSLTIKLAQLAVQTALYPLYELENGTVTEVRKVGRRLPVEEYLKPQGRFRHLLRPGAEKELALIQALADANAQRFGYPPLSSVTVNK
ncbi:MAG: pyruvate ferredoxin oxidoreductase [Chloroflexi bacterium]|nr:pyruvate ferredoxin oxidoreductase [Chloroflexota bacterium]